MHSILDAAVFDFCRVCTVVALHDWKSFVKNRKVAVAEVEGRTFDEILKVKVDDYLGALERESLPKKVDHIYDVCRPEAGYSRIRNYRYDRSELVRIDNLRHDCVHGRLPRQPVPAIEAVLRYMLDTGNNLLGLINDRYDVRVDPSLIQADLQQK